MFKSKIALNTTDVWLKFTFNGKKTIKSVYLSLDESDTSQHIGMELWIGGETLASSTFCYRIIAATNSRWITCGKTGITGTNMWIIMPVIG
jgi:hypothetical protein